MSKRNAKALRKRRRVAAEAGRSVRIGGDAMAAPEAPLPQPSFREKLTDSSSHRLKLAWGEAHIDRLEAVVDYWAMHNYKVTVERGPSDQIRAYGQLLEPVPREVPLIVGDAVQCMRQSLDHVVFALSKLNPEMTWDKEHLPEFPIILDSTRKPVGPGHRGLQFLTDAAKAELLNWTPKPEKQDVQPDELWVLNRLGNRDKHREIPVVVVSPRLSAGFSAAVIREFRTYGGDDELEPGGPPVLLLEFRGLWTEGDFVNVFPAVLFGSVTAGASGAPVIEKLRWMHAYIRDVVFDRLELHLP
jgi:hypothetical protein